jgi:hypothetical protein
LFPKIISGDSRRSENAQTYTNKHTIPNMKFKLKLLQIKCHALVPYNRQSPKCASKDNQSFCGSVRLSYFLNTLFVALFEPRDVGHALSDLIWVNAMHEELENSERNQV